MGATVASASGQAVSRMPVSVAFRPSTVWKKKGRLTKARPWAVKVQVAAVIDSAKIGRLKTSIGIIGSASRFWRHTNSVPSTTARTSSAGDHQPLMAMRHAVDAEDQQPEGGARQHRRDHVERPVGVRGVRQVALGQDEGDDAERRVDGEQVSATRRSTEQRRADRGAGGQRGRDHGGVEAEPAAQLVARIDRAHQRGLDRHDGGTAQPLEGAARAAARAARAPAHSRSRPARTAPARSDRRGGSPRCRPAPPPAAAR